MSSRCLRSERAIFFMGSIRERMVCRHHSSRNLPAQEGELYSQSCWNASLRGRQKISVSTMREQAIVPVAVKGISPKPEFRHLFVGDLDARWIAVWIKTASHSKARLGGRGGNEIGRASCRER